MAKIIIARRTIVTTRNLNATVTLKTFQIPSAIVVIIAITFTLATRIGSCTTTYISQLILYHPIASMCGCRLAIFTVPNTVSIPIICFYTRTIKQITNVVVVTIIIGLVRCCDDRQTIRWCIRCCTGSTTTIKIGATEIDFFTHLTFRTFFSCPVFVKDHDCFTLTIEYFWFGVATGAFFRYMYNFQSIAFVGCTYSKVTQLNEIFTTRQTYQSFLFCNTNGVPFFHWTIHFTSWHTIL